MIKCMNIEATRMISPIEDQDNKTYETCFWHFKTLSLMNAHMPTMHAHADSLKWHFFHVRNIEACHLLQQSMYTWIVIYF